MWHLMLNSKNLLYIFFQSKQICGIKFFAQILRRFKKVGVGNVSQSFTDRWHFINVNFDSVECRCWTFHSPHHRVEVVLGAGWVFGQRCRAGLGKGTLDTYNGWSGMNLEQVVLKGNLVLENCAALQNQDKFNLLELVLAKKMYIVLKYSCIDHSQGLCS